MMMTWAKKYELNFFDISMIFTRLNMTYKIIFQQQFSLSFLYLSLRYQKIGMWKMRRRKRRQKKNWKILYSIRGLLGTLIVISATSGILLGYIVGDFVRWNLQPLIYLTISYIFLAGAFIIHDSPLYLLQNSRFKVNCHC